MTEPEDLPCVSKPVPVQESALLDDHWTTTEVPHWLGEEGVAVRRATGKPAPAAQETGRVVQEELLP